MGRRVVQALVDRGKQVRALAHRPGREHLFSDPGVEVRYGDVTDVASVQAAMEGVGLVVHLVAIITEHGDATFERVTHQGTRNVVHAAQEAGVQGLVYLGALGAVDDPHFPYLQSKWRAEQAIIESTVPYTILRASIQFGEGDEFVNKLAGMVKGFPIVPVAGNGLARFQLIAVEEVAECIAHAVDREDLRGQPVEIGGPEQSTYDEIIDVIIRTYRLRRLKVHVPLTVMRKIVWLMERALPQPPATLQQLDMLAFDNVAQVDTVERVFGFKPRSLEGSIDYIRSISRWDGLRIALGFMPKRIRDH